MGYVAYLPSGAELCAGSLPLQRATNQQAELLAAAYALQQLYDTYGRMQVRLHSDSEYVVRGVNEWLPGWLARGWRKRTGGVPKNEAHWRRLHAALQLHDVVVVVWVRGHAGTVGNERADVLAGLARQQALQAA